FAPEDLKIGDKFRTRIDESIRIYDKVMVILSANSINSPWVEKEVEAALEKERKQNKLVLFPIRLDDAVMETDRAWAGQPPPHAPHRRLPRLEGSQPIPESVRTLIARPQSGKRVGVVSAVLTTGSSHARCPSGNRTASIWM